MRHRQTLALLPIVAAIVSACVDPPREPLPPPDDWCENGVRVVDADSAIDVVDAGNLEQSLSIVCPYAVLELPSSVAVCETEQDGCVAVESCGIAIPETPLRGERTITLRLKSEGSRASHVEGTALSPDRCADFLIGTEEVDTDEGLTDTLIRVVFRPTAVGTCENTLTISTDDCGDGNVVLSVDITAEGVDGIPPTDAGSDGGDPSDAGPDPDDAGLDGGRIQLDGGFACENKCDCGIGEVCRDGACAPPPETCQAAADCPVDDAGNCEALLCNGFTGECFDPNGG